LAASADITESTAAPAAAAAAAAAAAQVNNVYTSAVRFRVVIARKVQQPLAPRKSPHVRMDSGDAANRCNRKFNVASCIGLSKPIGLSRPIGLPSDAQDL
jgi:hypothetical protein